MKRKKWAFRSQWRDDLRFKSKSDAQDFDDMSAEEFVLWSEGKISSRKREANLWDIEQDFKNRKKLKKVM